MKKLILSMVFATMFIACADNSVCPSPEYTQPEQDTTYTQPIQDTTYNPIQDTTDTNSVTPDTTSETPVYYDVIIGGICTDMNVHSTGTLTGKSDTDVFTLNWLNKCLDTRKLYDEHMSFTEDNYTLDQTITILTDNLSFDSNLVNSLLTQVGNSGSIVYIYNTNSGLNFLYIRYLGEN